MAIKRLPKPTDVESFINGAPDGVAPVTQRPAAAPVAPVSKPEPVAVESSGRKQSISLTVVPGLLHRIDATARNRGLSRAAAFAIGMSEWCDRQERGA